MLSQQQQLTWTHCQANIEKGCVDHKLTPPNLAERYAFVNDMGKKYHAIVIQAWYEVHVQDAADTQRATRNSLWNVLQAHIAYSMSRLWLATIDR